MTTITIDMLNKVLDVDSVARMRFCNGEYMSDKALIAHVKTHGATRYDTAGVPVDTISAQQIVNDYYILDGESDDEADVDSDTEVPVLSRKDMDRFKSFASAYQAPKAAAPKAAAPKTPPRQAPVRVLPGAPKKPASKPWETRMALAEHGGGF